MPGSILACANFLTFYAFMCVLDCYCTMRSSNKKNLLTVPHLSLALSAEAFCVSAPTVWNSLSDACREAELVSIFRSRLKTELFNVAYVSKLV